MSMIIILSIILYNMHYKIIFYIKYKKKDLKKNNNLTGLRWKNNWSGQLGYIDFKIIKICFYEYTIITRVEKLIWQKE